MNTLTHQINLDGSLSRKPAKEGKRKKKGKKPVPKKNKTQWGWTVGEREICDLKTVAGREEYARRKFQMWVGGKGLCCICHTFVAYEDCEFEHATGRGFNGSHRDDRIKDNGVAHHDCNSKKGSKRA